ncbi:MAG TPA: DnaJ domain-containing protein [Chitinophagales bacterium]|nr:DnaJ domain-containing protein [Chitinophagales bacterium]
MASRISINNLFNAVAKMMADEEPVNTKQQKNPQQKAHDDEIQQAVLVLAADVIRCNRNFTSDTEALIYDFMARHFGATGLRQKMKTISQHIDTGTEPYMRMACKELKILATYDSCLSIVGFLFGVAGADDFVNAKEIRCIARIAKYLGVTEHDFTELKYRFTSVNSPYAMLGVDESASFEHVKAAYRKMVLKYHPDKRQKGMSDADANKKFREVQHAFETIKERVEKAL